MSWVVYRRLFPGGVQCPGPRQVLHIDHTSACLHLLCKFFPHFLASLVVPTSIFLGQKNSRFSVGVWVNLCHVTTSAKATKTEQSPHDSLYLQTSGLIPNQLTFVHPSNPQGSCAMVFLPRIYNNKYLWDG